MKFTGKIIIILFIISTINITGCLNDNNLEKDDSIKTLKIGLTDKIFGFYPFINSYDLSTMEINFNIYDGLVDFDENFRIKPRLAKSWNNPNQNTWRFNLRENIKFHSGDDLTSEDNYTETLDIYDLNSFEQDGNTIYVAYGNLTYIPENETIPIQDNTTVWFTQDYLNVTQWEQVLFLEIGDYLTLEIQKINDIFYCLEIITIT